MISSSDIHTWLLYGDKWPKVRDGPHHSDRCVAVLVALEAQLGLHTCRQLHNNSMANQDIWNMKTSLVLTDKLEDTVASGGESEVYLRRDLQNKRSLCRNAPTPFDTF